MFRYLVRRLLTMIPMFFLMTSVYFAVQNYLPGGPVQEMLSRIQYGGGEGGGRTMNVDDIAKLKAELERQYGLDKPIPVRYWNWLKKISVLDFGDSMTTREPALKTIAERVPVSMGFGIPGFFLTYFVCIVLGMVKALKDGTRFDVSSSVVLFVAYSIPALVLSVVFLLVLCTDRVLPGGALFPLGGARSDDWDTFTTLQKIWDYSKHMFLPVCASLLGGFTFLTMLMKNSLLDVLSADFIRTARAKGLSEKRVIFKHALRNAILPLMVGIGGFLSAFVAGSIVIESVFGLPGMGRLLIESLTSRDYNVLMGVAVIQSGIVMFGQLVSDVAYVLVDPRIDFEGRG
ncbi:MAG: ABC transporter permease subunit [Bdellovibrionales bacterium]|nr:ABC transporter permease subunit [Bdellovibrionales bacterium]